MSTITDDFTTDHFADSTYAISDGDTQSFTNGYQANTPAVEGVDFFVASGLRMPARGYPTNPSLVFRKPGAPLPSVFNSALIEVNVSNDNSDSYTMVMAGWTEDGAAFPHSKPGNGLMAGIINGNDLVLFEINDAADSGDGFSGSAGIYGPTGTSGTIPAAVLSGVYTLSVRFEGGVITMQVGDYIESYTPPPALVTALKTRTLVPTVGLNFPSFDSAPNVTSWSYAIDAPLPNPAGSLAPGRMRGGTMRLPPVFNDHGLIIP